MASGNSARKGSSFMAKSHSTFRAPAMLEHIAQLKAGNAKLQADAATRAKKPVAAAQLSEKQFNAADNAVTKLIRTKAPNASSVSKAWEAALAMPQRTWQNRQDRLNAIGSVAAKHGLVPS